MAHRAGGRTCRARRPGLPADLPGPERLRALLLLGPRPAPAPGTALPGSKLKARFWETRGGRAGPDGGLAAPSLPRRPRAFISSAPARPLRRARLRAASTARRARHPRCPTHQRTPPALRAETGKPTPETPTWRAPREDPPPSPIALVLTLSVSVGTGRGRFSLADPSRMLKKGSAPHAQLRPAWLERLSLWCRRRKDVAPPGDGGSARGPSPEDQHPVGLGLSGGLFQPHLSSPPALH